MLQRAKVFVGPNLLSNIPDIAGRVSDDDRISQTEFANYTQELAPELHGLEKALFTLYDSDHDHRLEMGDFVRFYEAIDTSGK